MIHKIWFEVLTPQLDFLVFMVMKIQVVAFWVVILCSVAVRYQCFGGPCCLHLQSEELQWRKMHNAGPQAPCGHHFTSKTISPGKFCTKAMANCMLESPPTDTHHQKNTAKQVPEKCTDSNTITLITTV
jgi:hypothetical protein